MNEVIIRDINLLFKIDEFSKEFTKMYIVFLINFFLNMIKYIDREVSKFDCVPDFFEFISNNSIFAKHNQVNDTICSNNYRNF